MSSKSKRRKQRSKRRQPITPKVTDPHLQVVMKLIAGVSNTAAELVLEDSPALAVDARMADIVEDLTTRFGPVEPVRIVEIARLMCLPWPWNDMSVAEGGAARAELIALIAVTAFHQPVSEVASDISDANNSNTDLIDFQPILRMVTKALPRVDSLLELAQVREIFRTDIEDALGKIAALMRATEMWMRSTSYPEMAAETVRQLFSPADVTAALVDGLGFDANQALGVLAACHTIQIEKLHVRMERLGDQLPVTEPDQLGGVDDEARTEFVQQWNAAWDAEAHAVTASTDEIAAEVGQSTEVVGAVLNYFQLDIDNLTPTQVVNEFAAGNNPLRTHPIIRTPDGSSMMVHDSNVAPAVREALEQYLKGTSIWESYQAARGNLLERRTHDAFARVLPSADFWDGFEYYIPAAAAEVDAGPDGYTKRVEGDHLIVQDDVAIIIEDKAVAVTPQSRAGETRKLRRNLVDIIKKASDQAGRLQDRINKDGGIRIHGTGWLDLSHVREIHTVAVSLDDLPSVSTATAELVQARLLDPNHIPWTVSLHDLDLISMLIDLAAEFLLYLRRRRDPLATIVYTAPDELDLFLYFFQRGLYVEPDPDRLRDLLPFMPEPTVAQRRRYREQRPTYIAAQTDPLDRWYRANLVASSVPPAPGSAAPAETAAVAPKPAMSESPLRALVTTLQVRGNYAWLSIGATLLSCSFATQASMARIPGKLLANPSDTGRERTVAIPLASNTEDGWLMVWMTRPAKATISSIEGRARDYLRTKKHQMSLPRGVAFVYDESKKELINVLYDGNRADLEPRLQTLLSLLRPVGNVDKLSHLTGSDRASSRTRKRPAKRRRRRRL